MYSYSPHPAKAFFSDYNSVKTPQPLKNLNNSSFIFENNRKIEAKLNFSEKKPILKNWRLSESQVLPSANESSVYNEIVLMLEDKMDDVSSLTKNNLENKENKSPEKSLESFKWEEKYSPIQNKSLMSNINEILSMINREESSISEDQDKNMDLNHVNKLTSHINETLKDMHFNLKKGPLNTNIKNNKALESSQKLRTERKEKLFTNSMNEAQNVKISESSESIDPSICKTLLVEKIQDSQLKSGNNSTMDKTDKNNSLFTKKTKMPNLKRLSAHESTCLNDEDNDKLLLSTFDPINITMHAPYLKKGMVLVLKDELAGLKDKLASISEDIAWAIFHKNLLEHQKLKIFEHLNKKDIQLLFITVELLLFESYFEFPDVDLLIIDDIEKYIDELNGFYFPIFNNHNHKIFTMQAIIERVKPKQILCLTKERLRMNLNNIALTCGMSEEHIYSEKNFDSNISFINDPEKLNHFKNLSVKQRNAELKFLLTVKNKNFCKSESSKLLESAKKININAPTQEDPFNNYSIVFNLPSNLGRNEKEKMIYFSSEEDYFSQRETILQDHTSESAVANVLMSIFCLNDLSKGKSTVNKVNNCLNLIHNSNIGNTNNNFKNGIKSIKYSDLVNFGIQKKKIKSLICFLENVKWVEIIGSVATSVEIKVINLKFDPKGERLMRAIAKNAKKDKGRLEIGLKEISRDSGMNLMQTYDILKQFEQEGMIKMVIKEEVLSYKILYNPDLELIDEKAKEIFEIYDLEEKIKLKKLDTIYIIFKYFSYNSFEYFLRSEKKNKTLNGLSFKQIMEKYLEIEDPNQLDTFLLETGLNLEKSIPLLKINKKRDRSEIYKDFEELIYQNLELIKTSKNLAIQLVQIVKGDKDLFKKNPKYQNNKFWRKYYKYDEKELFDIAIQTIETFFLERRLNQSKKIKIL